MDACPHGGTPRSLRVARREREVSLQSTPLQTRTKWPRHAISNEAIRLKLTARRWQKDELALMASRAGEIDADRLARRLGRSARSIRIRAHQLGVSLRVRTDYSIDDIRDIFGRRAVNSQRLDRAESARQHRPNIIRSTSPAMPRLCILSSPHMTEYSFRKADETFLKGVLNGSKEGTAVEAYACPACRGEKTRTGS